MRKAAVWTLMLSSVGIVSQWEYKSYWNLDFPTWAHRFQDATPGTTMTIPILPFGDWKMTLTKHGQQGSLGR